MRLPRISQTSVLLGLLAVLLLGSVLNNRESLLYCERALAAEMETLRKEGTVKGPVKFTDVCPEVRQRAENNLNKWLEVLLALMVQWHPPASQP
jgi:hypothetical protein